MKKMNKSKLVVALLWGIFLSCNPLQSKDAVSHVETTKKHNLSICAVFKNEAKYLKEWIEYHMLVGVDHFYLYNVNSTDQYMKVLKNYIQNDVVTLVQWPFEAYGKSDREDIVRALTTHISAYENAVRYTAFAETKWLVFVNVDEYLLPPNENSLREILEQYDECPGIILARDYFDASKERTAQKKSSLIETVNKVKAPKENRLKSVEKTIFKPEQCGIFMLEPYRFVFNSEVRPVRVNKNELCVNQYLNRNGEVSFFGKMNESAYDTINVSHIENEYDDEQLNLVDFQ